MPPGVDSRHTDEAVTISTGESEVSPTESERESVQHRARVSPRPPLPGIFPTIAGAMSLLLVQPLLMAIPVLFDLHLWAGTRVSAAALTEPLARWLRDLETTSSNSGTTSGAEPGEIAARIERIADITPAVGFFVPSVLFGIDADEVARIWRQPVLDLGSGWLVLAATLALTVVGIGIGMAFRVSMAGSIRGGGGSRGAIGREIAVAWASYAVFLALVVAVMIVIAVPASIVSALMLVVGINILPLLVPLIATPAVAAVVLLWFVPDAIAIGQAGPLRACALSFGVVRRNLWPSIGFILVALVINSGAARVLRPMVDTIPGVLIAIAIFAFLATGLTLAQMQFFYDRWLHWHGAPPVPISVRSA